MLSTRFEMRIPTHLYDKAKAEAERLGIPLAEFIKDLMKKELYD